MKYLREYLRRFIEEDVGFSDITTESIIPEGTQSKGLIIVKEDGVIAGLEEAKELFTYLDLKAEAKYKDGDYVKAGTIVMEVKGEAKKILAAERIVLNIMMRMSGIATETRKLVDRIKEAGLKVRVAATRKTAPGLRFLDKKAVMLGGGDTHRLRLDDAVIIKDNHIVLIGSISEAIKKAREKISFTKKIEVETRTLEEALEAARTGADIIMLDNMTLEQIKEVVSRLKEEGLYGKVLLEASGNINTSNILEYASTGVDVVSLGYLTHSSKALDLSLQVSRI